jgi:hypothetical protein
LQPSGQQPVKWLNRQRLNRLRLNRLRLSSKLLLTQTKATKDKVHKAIKDEDRKAIKGKGLELVELLPVKATKDEDRKAIKDKGLELVELLPVKATKDKVRKATKAIQIPPARIGDLHDISLRVSRHSSGKACVRLREPFFLRLRTVWVEVKNSPHSGIRPAGEPQLRSLQSLVIQNPPAMRRSSPPCAHR